MYYFFLFSGLRDKINLKKEVDEGNEASGKKLLTEEQNGKELRSILL